MPQNGRVTSTEPISSTATAEIALTTANGEHRGTLGLGQGTALYIASVLGTGILVLPGLAAAAAGPASILAVAAVLVLSIPLAGTFAALASRYPDAGGVASYVRRALGGTKTAKPMMGTAPRSTPSTATTYSPPSTASTGAPTHTPK